MEAQRIKHTGLLVFTLLGCTLNQLCIANDFYIAFTADPQYPWACAARSECARQAQGVEAQSQLSNTWQSDSINHLIERYKETFKGVIVNGDLTAFGHNWQLPGFETYFRNRIKAPVFIGLGNHDYANNVNDCFSNHCARRMVDYLAQSVNAMSVSKLLSHWTRAETPQDYLITGFDYAVAESRKESAYEYIKKHRGSLAYSFEIGNVHFVQLNNYPSYETSFEGLKLHPDVRNLYEITPAFSWLEKDLQKADQAGKTLIVNMHDFAEHISTADKEKAIALFSRYHVAGVFWGHFHGWVGHHVIKGKVSGETLDGFHCGSTPFNTYLLAHFKDDKLFEVSTIKSDFGEALVQEVYQL